MKNRVVRVLVITIIMSTLYILFFLEDVVDTPKHENKIQTDTINLGSKLDTLLMTNDYLVLGKSTDVQLIKLSDSSNYKGFKIMESFQNDAIIANNPDVDNFEIYKKFSLNTFFESNKVPVYNGKLADPDFTSNEDAKMFRTRITEGCEDGINFAGFYTLIYWGCGTSCQYGVIVNRKTGEIFDGHQSSLGSEFKKDSESIIMNSDIIEGDSQYIPLYQFKDFDLKVWKNTTFKDYN